MRLPIDTSSLTFLCAVGPEPVVDFDTKRPKVEDGVPLFAVQLVALGDGGAEVVTVKVAGEPPKGVAQGATVRVDGLVASPWSMGDRSGVAFRAERIEPATGPARAAV